MNGLRIGTWCGRHAASLDAVAALVIGLISGAILALCV